MLFLAIFAFMFFHISIATIGTVFAWWHSDSTPYSVALTTFLYYVLPLSFLLFIYFFTCQLLHPSKENSEEWSLDKPTPTKKAFPTVRPVPNKKASSNNRPVPNRKASSNSKTVPSKKTRVSDKLSSLTLVLFNVLLSMKPKPFSALNHFTAPTYLCLQIAGFLIQLFILYDLIIDNNLLYSLCIN